MPAGLVALALGSFGIGLTEFVIAGLLPHVSRDLGVSEAAAGWLIMVVTARIGREHLASAGRLPAR